MQPVIPLQPYIAQGEGSGSAFILPRQQRQSAIDVLAQDFKVKKAEEQARNKQFQDELVALEGLGKGLLPNDEKRIRDEYEKHLGWIGQQGLTGTMNPANPASPNYLENKKKMNQMSSLANIGKYRKELLTDLQKKALTGEYDEESLNKQRDYITNTPIEEFDVNKVGQIEKRFDPNAFLKKSLADLEVYNFATAHDLCTQAQTAPPADLPHPDHCIWWGGWAFGTASSPPVSRNLPADLLFPGSSVGQDRTIGCHE